MADGDFKERVVELLQAEKINVPDATKTVKAKESGITLGDMTAMATTVQAPSGKPGSVTRQNTLVLDCQVKNLTSTALADALKKCASELDGISKLTSNLREEKTMEIVKKLKDEMEDSKERANLLN